MAFLLPHPQGDSKLQGNGKARTSVPISQKEEPKHNSAVDYARNVGFKTQGSSSEHFSRVGSFFGTQYRRNKFSLSRGHGRACRACVGTIAAGSSRGASGWPRGVSTTGVQRALVFPNQFSRIPGVWHSLRLHGIPDVLFSKFPLCHTSPPCSLVANRYYY